MDRSPEKPELPETPPKRKRGAQPGNTNALKHGFYTHYYEKIELDALKDGYNLDAEINMLRVAIQRLFNLTAHADEKSLTASLTALARASATLARIIEANQRIRGQDSEMIDTINRAVNQINRELSSKRRASPQKPQMHNSNP